MAPLPLLQGAYTARSLIANAQRCVNLYPENNTQDAEAPFTHYPRPGLTLLATANEQRWRGLFRASNDQLFGCVGNAIYYITPYWQLILVGTIASYYSPVKMADNGTTLVIVDGSAQGWLVDLSTHAFSQIIDAAFYGGNTVEYLDTFLLFPKPNSKQFYSTLSNTIVPFDPLYFGSKVGYPDRLSTLAVMHREIWLFGAQRATEIWYLEGADAGFPFSRLPGSYIEQGCLAPASVAKNDLKLFWLGQNQNGSASVFMGAKYSSQQISTFAIEYEINSYPVLSDAIGMTYNQQGHDFYVLTFPTADKTWVYDQDTGLWHEETWTDSNGQEHRTRANCMASAYGQNICGDWENGNLYALDPAAGTDNGDAIVRRRSFPHLVSNGNRVGYNVFRADMDCGNSLGTAVSNPAKLYLRWSDDRGHSFGNPLEQNFGASGQYLVQAQWRQLGYARDRVFELFWSDPAFTALNGAWVEGESSAT